MDAPRSKQLAVSKRVRVPGPEASWTDLHAFAQTYDARIFFSQRPGTIASLAYRPVFDAAQAEDGITGDLGVDFLRAALWFQAYSDGLAGAAGFTSTEVERLYRGVAAALHARLSGWVDEQR